MSFTLRPYQEDAFKAILEAWKEYRSTLLDLPTGLGKIAIAAAIMREQATSGVKCCFVADTDELCAEATSRIFRATGEHPALEKADSRVRGDERFVVASLQTLARDNRLAGEAKLSGA